VRRPMRGGQPSRTGRAGIRALALLTVIAAAGGCGLLAGCGGRAATLTASSAAGASPGHPAPTTAGHAPGRPGATPGPHPAATGTLPAFTGLGPLRTSCRSVLHIGDSTSDGLDSADYLPDRHQRITARYHQVGVRHVFTDIVGARSVFETLPGTVNGYDAALSYDRRGFRGCWVIALGTDDTADVAVGSAYSLTDRIQHMMSAARGQPVLWVNVRSLVHSGPYAEANMRKWNEALLRSCRRYPNMRIFNWAALARPGWFISDGIHYTSNGYEHRALLIADALARAFPLSGLTSPCVVS
jgi:hypothetical protein